MTKIDIEELKKISDELDSYVVGECDRKEPRKEPLSKYMKEVRDEYPDETFTDEELTEEYCDEVMEECYDCDCPTCAVVRLRKLVEKISKESEVKDV